MTLVGPDHGMYTSKIRPQDQQVIDDLTQPPNWDYPQWRRVLIALATAGNGNFVPAHHRPETINLQVWETEAAALNRETLKDGLERATPILVDTEKKALIGGKRTVGTHGGVVFDKTPQPGKEQFQRCIGTIHTHPFDIATPMMGGSDYLAFLPDASQIAMMMAWGGFRVLVVKTSVTPNNISSDLLKRRLAAYEEELDIIDNENIGKKYIEYNKMICTEFGLVLYLGDEKQGGLVKRIEVTK